MSLLLQSQPQRHPREPHLGVLESWDGQSRQLIACCTTGVARHGIWIAILAVIVAASGTTISLVRQFHGKEGQDSFNWVNQSLPMLRQGCWLLVAPQVWLLMTFGLPSWLLMQCHLATQWVLYSDPTPKKVKGASLESVRVMWWLSKVDKASLESTRALWWAFKVSLDRRLPPTQLPCSQPRTCQLVTKLNQIVSC